MPDKDPNQNEERSWFIVSESGEEEFFPETPAGHVPSPAQSANPSSLGRQETTAAPEIPPAQIERIELESELGKGSGTAPTVRSKASQRATQEAGARSSDPSAEVPPMQVEGIKIELEPEFASSAVPSVRVLESEFETLVTEPQSALGCPTTVVAQPGPMSDRAPAPPVGFQRGDSMRVGGTAPTPPVDLVGFLVVVKTPQRVRLGQVMALKTPRTAIGRGSGVGCFLDDPTVAEIHAVITHQREQNTSSFVLYALASAPVSVNGAPATAQTRLASNDRIAAGRTELAFFEVQITCGEN